MKPLQSSPVSSLGGVISVPGDKSISHRALMLSSQAPGVTRIRGLLEGEDVLGTARALGRLGVSARRTGEQEWEVEGVGIGGLSEPDGVLDMGNAGTGARLMMGLVAPYPFTTFFTGDASLCSRPMARVITPLQQMGVRFLARSGRRLPLAVTGCSTAIPITYRLPVASAQVKSAILLAGLNIAGVTTVIEPEATRDHTENMLEHLGFELERRRQQDDGAFIISLAGHQDVARQEREIDVPADPSSAAFPLVAALITPGSELMVRQVCINPLRIGLFTSLREMGAQIEFRNPRKVAGEAVADIAVRGGPLKGITVPASRAPSMIDEYPILAVAAACAHGESVMHGLSELRVKESDRLSAIIDGLIACGVQARADGDTLIVQGCGGMAADNAPAGGAKIVTHYDHRIAMAFLVLGMACASPVTVDDAEAIATSFPGFDSLMNEIGANITPLAKSAKAKPGVSLPPMLIAIDGPAASGKGTVARRLAENLGFSYLDTGSLYRAVGMKLIYGGKDPSKVEDAVEAALSIDEEDFANPRLRQERIGQAASIVSAMPEVRDVLLEFQRRFARTARGAVLDGRDIGTVVCPDADFKVFLTAELEARAKRRHRQLQGQGIQVVYDSVLADLIERDARDRQRQIAPMRPADDAVVIDTSNMDANKVFEAIRDMIVERSRQKRKTA